MEPTQEQVKKMNRNKLDWLKNQSVDLKIDLIQNHLSLCQILINEVFEEEVIQKAGPRYSRDKPANGSYSRWGFNPGSVKIGDKKIRVSVPRLMDNVSGKNVELKNYDHLKQISEPTEQLLRGVLLGLSMEDYEGVIDHLGESFGLKKSSISRAFKKRSSGKLEEFQKRSLAHYDFVSLMIDGKYLQKEQIMIVLGITINGDKVPLDFMQMHSEHSVPIAALLNRLKERGLKWQDGLLMVIDGSKGIRKGITTAFGNKAVIQRCSWHKRENVMSYLKESDKSWVKRKYDRALSQDTYSEAKSQMVDLKRELNIINIAAANSLNEGIEDILTLHRLGLNTHFQRSFSTTNCIENLNSQLVKYLRKVKYWKNSNQRYRWVATALLEIEQKMRKVNNYKKLPEMKKIIKQEINSREKPSLNPISTNNGT